MITRNSVNFHILIAKVLCINETRLFIKGSLHRPFILKHPDDSKVIFYTSKGSKEEILNFDVDDG